MNQELFDLLEGQRRKAASGVIVSVVFGIVAVLLFFISMANPSGNSGLIIVAFILFMVTLLYFFVAVNPLLREYKYTYKTQVVNAFFAKHFTNFKYDPFKGFDETLIKATGLMQLGNRYHTEDLMSGRYKDVEFARADVVIEDHRSNGKSSYTVTYFKGRWMIFSFNKRFRSDIQIIEKGFGYSKQKSTIFTRKEDRRHNFQTENIEFNNAFKCLCQNEAEAFYVLTPHLMESILHLRNSTDGEVMFGFVNNTLHVAINNNKDAFEPHITSPINYEDDILPLTQELKGITDFVDELSLDRNIFIQ